MYSRGLYTFVLAFVLILVTVPGIFLEDVLDARLSWGQQVRHMSFTTPIAFNDDASPRNFSYRNVTNPMGVRKVSATIPDGVGTRLSTLLSSRLIGVIRNGGMIGSGI